MTEASPVVTFTRGDLVDTKGASGQLMPNIQGYSTAMHTCTAATSRCQSADHQHEVTASTTPNQQPFCITPASQQPIENSLTIVLLYPICFRTFQSINILYVI